MFHFGFHRAEEWGLDKPLFTGCLQIFQADLKLRIALYSYKDQSRLIMDPDNIVPFGQCPIGKKRYCQFLFSCWRLIRSSYYLEIKPGESITNFVDGVIDSSRYYVVRLKVNYLFDNQVTLVWLFKFFLYSFLMHLFDRTQTLAGGFGLESDSESEKSLLTLKPHWMNMSNTLIALHWPPS